jgi:hypothetical protein
MKLIKIQQEPAVDITCGLETSDALNQKAAKQRVAAKLLEKVRFCRDRFSPTGELGYSGIRGAVGLGNRSTV